MSSSPSISSGGIGERGKGASVVEFSLFDESTEPKNLVQSELENIIKKLKRFVEFSLEKDIYDFFEVGSSSFDAAQVIRDNWKNVGKSLRFYLISNRPASKDIHTIYRRFKLNCSVVPK